MDVTPIRAKVIAEVLSVGSAVDGSHVIVVTRVENMKPNLVFALSPIWVDYLAPLMVNQAAEARGRSGTDAKVEFNDLSITASSISAMPSSSGASLSLAITAPSGQTHLFDLDRDRAVAAIEALRSGLRLLSSATPASGTKN